MNIKNAKEQIRRTVISYLMKDEFGDYRMPVQEQRPIFLMGPPGIGKTAIMEQIAGEMDLALVSYSMTHHTRQSALGLPYIRTEEYRGKEYRISEYTMSEIIASIYAVMKETGKQEGILFLDEINCVSETLAPSMLQFLQYKTFGRHQVPEGWILVTAGNPPAYNRSVRDFDIVTWDRLKRIDVEPDFDAWREYALGRSIHPAVLTYLEIKKDDFYKVQTSVDGKTFVTARGWSDLSDMIRLYEKNGFPVDEDLTAQYLQEKRIAKDFAVYYDLYQKYRSDYQVNRILNGEASGQILERAKKSPFDERLTLIGLLMEKTGQDLRNIYDKEQILRLLMEKLKAEKAGLQSEEGGEVLATLKNGLQEDIRLGKAASVMPPEKVRLYKSAVRILEKAEEAAAAGSVWNVVLEVFQNETACLKKMVKKTGRELSNIFSFLEQAYGDGNEIMLLVTQLTENRYSASFLRRYGCEEYFAHNQGLLVYDRQQDVMREIDKLL